MLQFRNTSANFSILVMTWCVGCLDICGMPFDQISQFLFLDEIPALQTCSKNLLQRFPASSPDRLIEECARIIAIAKADVGQEFTFLILMFNSDLLEWRHYYQKYITLYQEFIHAYEVQIYTPDGLRMYDCDTIIKFLERYCQKPNDFGHFRIFMPSFDDIRPLLRQIHTLAPTEREIPFRIPVGFEIQKESLTELDAIIKREDEAAINIARFDKIVKRILKQHSVYYRMRNNFWCFIRDLYFFRMLTFNA